MQLVSCEHPKYQYIKSTGRTVLVRCGHCAACRSLVQSDLVQRMAVESSQHKYCFFFTLTYDEGHVPFKFGVRSVDRSDIQKFLKRFRISFQRELFKDCISQKISIYRYATEKSLRYFISSEYGPEKYRPHYHGLVWFNSPKLCAKFGTYLSKAWPFGRVDYSPSRSAGKYCSKYITGTPYLPKVYDNKELRTFCLYSKMPAFGFEKSSYKEIRQIATKRAQQDSFALSESNVSIPFYKSFENRLFPKCRGFAQLSHNDRIATYLFSRQIDRMYSLSVQRGFSRGLTLPQFLKNYSLDLCKDERMVSMYYLSRKFLRNCKYANLTSDQYVSFIELYYSRKDMFNLTKLYNYENQIVSYDSAALPFIVNLYDNVSHYLFSNFKAELDVSKFTADTFFNSIAFDVKQRWKFHFSKFHAQKQFFSTSRSIEFSNLKTRKLNDKLGTVKHSTDRYF